MPRNAVPQVGATWPQIGVGVGVDVSVGVVVEQHRQRRRRRRQLRPHRRRRCRCCCCRFRCPSSTIRVGKQFPDLPHQQRECAAFKRATPASCVSLPARSYGRRNWLNCRNGKPEMCDIGRQLHTLFPLFPFVLSYCIYLPCCNSLYVACPVPAEATALCLPN